MFLSLPLIADDFLSSDTVRTYILDEVVVYSNEAFNNPSTILSIPLQRISSQNTASLANLIQTEPGMSVTYGRKNSSDVNGFCVMDFGLQDEFFEDACIATFQGFINDFYKNFGQFGE